MAGSDSRRGGSRGCALLLNLLSLLIVVLVLVVVGGILLFFVSPDTLAPARDLLGLDAGGEPGEPTPTMAAMAIVPTATNTSVAAVAPTWTPEQPEATVPPTATNTRRPTAVPSITPTFPPPTATPTPTNTPTSTPTPGPSPTETATRSAFPFTRSDTSPQYLQNFANNAGCNWMGVAGEVLDLNRVPVPTGQYRVHVWGSGIDARVPVGGAPAYSPSGWEQFLFDAPVIRDYNVQLETVNGTPVSEAYPIQSRASCNQNLVLFNFVQNHAIGG